MASSSSSTSAVDLAALQKHLHQTTSLAASLPPRSDLAFHRSVNPALAVRLDEASGRIWGLVDSLLGLVEGLDEGKGRKRAREEEDLVERFDEVVVDGAVDALLERADTCLDTFLGRLKAPAIPIIPTETARSKNNLIIPGSTSSSAKPARLASSLINAQIPKPQLLFPSPPQNFPEQEFKTYSNSKTPEFKKYHAQVPLDYVASVPEGEDAVEVVHPAEAIHGLPLSNGNNDDSRRKEVKNVPPHPYTYEILHPSYPTSLLAPKPSTPTPPASFDDTPFEFVDTLPALLDLIKLLENKATHLAVDLEHHSTRTFAGFLCLMQVTARDASGAVLGDWVVDLVQPEIRSGMKDQFGRVLANPNIIKIFHGAESDIVWLQQNFDLFVVNMFDTYHATKVLEFPSHSLASLLELYCDFMADKRYQLADWRIRPLPQEMLDYARSDTHFLLFIYGHLLNALISRSSPRSSPSLNAPLSTPAGGSFSVDTPLLLQHVLARSGQTCLRRFAADVYDSATGLGSAGWFSLAKKYNKLYLLDSAPGTPPAVEGAVYKALHAWRDRIAREEDESTAYVLKNHLLFILAGRKPATVRELFTMGQQFGEVVRRRADELVSLIRTTQEEAEGAAGPVGLDAMDGVVDAQTVGSADIPSSKHAIVDVWGAVQEPVAKLAPAVASSSFFGPSFTAKAASSSNAVASSSSRSYAAPSSSLFGSTVRKVKAAAAVPSSPRAGEGFLQVLSKINLSINPPPPVAAPAPTPAPAPVAAKPPRNLVHVNVPDESFSIPGVEQVPFVPASARTVKPDPRMAEKKDQLVTVGRPKENKRKRDKTSDAATAAVDVVDPKGKGREVDRDEMDEDEREAEEVEASTALPTKAFDYSAVPNGLDQVVKKDPPNKLKKAKKAKKPVWSYGDFGRAPQSMAETKKGNKNQTFKS